jgi:hypothetical protein
MENHDFKGYICPDCVNFEKKILNERIKCPHCKSSLKNEKRISSKIQTDDELNVWFKGKWFCPKCKQNVSLNVNIGSAEIPEINAVMLESLNIKELDDLIELYYQGYKIFSTQYSSLSNKEIETIKLAKGNAIKILAFENPSKDISKFFAEVHFIENKDSRPIAILMDPNKYWSHGVIPYKLNDTKIQISGFEFTDFKYISHTKPIIASKQQYFSFTINTAKDSNIDFLNVDFREPIKLIIKNKVEFVGYIARCIKNENILRIKCQSSSGEFKAETLNISINAKKNRTRELMAFLLDSYEIKHRIQGIDNSNRQFEIIIPIENFEINDSYQIGECYFLNNLPQNDFLIDKLKNTPTCAKVNINCSSFFQSYKIGLDIVQSALNLINFQIKFPSVIEFYHSEDQRSFPRIGSELYIIDIKYETEIFIRLPLSNPPKFQKEILINQYFIPIKKIGSILVKNEREFDSNLFKVKWILHYLNMAEGRRDRIDAFLNLCIALDFTLALFSKKDDKEFTKNEIKHIRNYCSNFSKFKFDNSSNNDEIDIERLKMLEKRLVEIINSTFNQRSLKYRTISMLKDANIMLSDTEEKIFRSARKKRNNIIHGYENVMPTKQEYNIISKIVFLSMKRYVEKIR